VKDAKPGRPKGRSLRSHQALRDDAPKEHSLRHRQDADRDAHSPRFTSRPEKEIRTGQEYRR
jgi:hypothetical protein